MPEYRRIYLEGSTYFFTIITYKRSPIFKNPIARNILHNTFEQVKFRLPFDIIAICLLPDHIHLLMRLPDNDSDYSMRIREIKRLFTISYKSQFSSQFERNASRLNKQEATIWQRRFWEHTIRDEKDLQNHFDYIHFNPVKHGLVEEPGDWQWSSFQRYVEMGFYPQDWGKIYSDSAIDNCFGE